MVLPVSRRNCKEARALEPRKKDEARRLHSAVESSAGAAREAEADVKLLDSICKLELVALSSTQEFDSRDTFARCPFDVLECAQDAGGRSVVSGIKSASVEENPSA